jgi:DNA-binding response OmpR family regulator
MVNRVYKILVVDDEPDVGNVLSRSLPRRLNVEVIVSDNGVIAVEIAKTFKPDLVLLDIHLPGHMGWDVLREIRSFNTDVKIVIVTGLFEVPQEDQEFILQQTSGYMTKPLNLDELIKKIIEILGSEVVK